MTLVMSERQFGGKPRRAGAGGFQTRHQGHGKAKRVWKCQHCGAEY